MTYDQNMQAALENDLAAVNDARIVTRSRNFEPGTGRVRFTGAKIQKGQSGKFFVVEGQILWFRGGMAFANPKNPSFSQMVRVSDETYREGEGVAVLWNLNWPNNAAFPHIKAWGLAMMQLDAARKGADASHITEAQIDNKIVAAILSNFSNYAGFECDFEVTAGISKKKQEQFNGIKWLPGRDMVPPAKSAAPAPAAAPAPSEPAASPLSDLARSLPTAAPAMSPTPADPLAALGVVAAPPVVAAPSADPLAGLIPAAAPAEPSRDAKIKAIREARPEYALADFTQVPDEAVDAAFAAL